METLYYNMKPGLRLHIDLKEASILEELIQRVQQIEEVQAQLPRDVPAENRATTKTSRPAHLLQAAFIRGQWCWRCGQRGHNRFKCPNRRKKFCSWCEDEDVFTRGCQCSKPKNEQQTGLKPPAARSKKQKHRPESFHQRPNRSAVVY